MAGLLPSIVFAQFSAPGEENAPGVTGHGTVVVKQPPVEMRMMLRLTEKAPTLKEALDKLKTRSEAVTLQLVQLGAPKDKIQVTEPTIAELTDRQKQMQMQRMMMMQRARGGRSPKGLKTPKSIAVATDVTAAWPLTSAGGRQALLQFCDDVQTKVAAADLAGLKEKKETTPEEQEVEEEESGMNFGSEEGENPGEPKFFFAGRITPDARQKATAEAFAKAQAHAKVLAIAAGAELGKLSSLTGGSLGAMDESAEVFGSRFGYYQGRRLSSARNEENESIAATLDEVNFSILVKATFELK